MNKLTVIIPTHRRPELLEKALQSVQNQTLHPDLVVVSENDENNRYSTVDVVKKFSKMPIEYRCTGTDKLSSSQHGYMLFQTYGSKSDYIAVLHDDDEWKPDHLEDGLNYLDLHKEASIYGCSFMSPYPKVSDYRLIPWFASAFGFVGQGWMLEHYQIVMAAIFGLPFHYSTMIGRGQAFVLASEVLNEGNDYDNDREIATRFDCAIYNDKANVLVREHGADKQTLAFDLYPMRLAQTSYRILSQPNIDYKGIAERFINRLKDCPDGMSSCYFHSEASRRKFCLPVLAQFLSSYPSLQRTIEKLSY